MKVIRNTSLGFSTFMIIHLAHLRMGEFVALIAAADFTRHFGVGVLIESCLADDLAFVERTRRLLRRLAEVKLAAKVGA